MEQPLQKGEVMTNFIILNSVDMLKIQANQPIVIQIDLRPYTLISEEGFNKIMGVKVEIGRKEQK